MTNELKVGDSVTKKDGTWSGPMTIKEIVESCAGPYATFEEGGLWRVSHLRKVST